MNLLNNVIKANKQGDACGIYSVCCAQPLVIEAALQQAAQDDAIVLIEATANQVNQYGGYTGMTPVDFVNFVADIAKKNNFPMDNIVLGGDHLGPVCWVDESYQQAQQRSKALIEAYVAAGFKKIHLDTSMPCADDPENLTDEIVAERAAYLCDVAEQTAIATFGQSDISYVIGTEVPPPGGAKEELQSVEVTPKHRVEKTLKTHQLAFEKLNLQAAWQRVIGLVVQPGVEFDHTQIIDYDHSATGALTEFIQTVPNVVYEAHSTDYQKSQAYKDLVSAHFAILKVGPQLTFAMREAVFALSHIEDELLDASQRSNIRDVFEQQMLSEPKYWQKFYEGSESGKQLMRKYSFSDRIRYYWNSDAVEQALQQLFTNLNNCHIPLPLISQYLPEQYQAIREQGLAVNAQNLVINKIRQVTQVYANACNNINK